MRRLSIADSNFLLAENRETPMHVGALNVYTLPKGVSQRRYMKELLSILRRDDPLLPPFGERLDPGLLGRTGLVRHWVPDEHMDMEYHVRHAALPKPGRYRELFALASRLHSTLLDRNRPLWVMYVIEGLRKRQFATYFKVHHCAIDGARGVHLMQSMLSPSPEGHVDYSSLSLQAWETYKHRIGSKSAAGAPSPTDLKAVAEALRQQLGVTVDVLSGLRRYGQVWLGMGGRLAAPWHRVPHGLLTQKISGSRRLVAESWPFDRVHDVGRALGATLNDVVLSMCAGALRRYHESQGESLDRPLKALAPISVRTGGDIDSANAIGFIITSLATDIPDPERRLRTIQASMQAGKNLYATLSPEAASLFTAVAFSPMLLTNFLGTANWFPAYNLVISNVPGPKQPMYWNGAPLDGIYPMNIVVHGQAMSITLVSYAGNLDFGIVACRRSVPRVQRMLRYLEESLTELESVAGTRAA
ncbi:WS/DGAT/MGAT family O-acyltransferase [Lentisalinibacter sediminis]|uniref:WS/DGAT/MGAT family O-acyltransferase n=1 Tax=Lentisalinibacter sediminis TaxID=2992237 RepID=UPI00386A1FAB